MTALAWTQVPRFTDAGSASLIALREASAVDAACRASQHQLAAWLWLLVGSTHLSAGDLWRALDETGGWPALLGEAERGGERLARTMGDMARAAAGDGGAGVAGHFLIVYPPLDDAASGPVLRVYPQAYLDVVIDFDALAAPLAEAVYGALTLISALLPLYFGSDLMQGTPYACERSEEYELLRDRGLLDDPAAALAFARERDFMTFELDNEETMAEVLAEAPLWLDGPSLWPADGPDESPAERARRLLETIAGWRTNDAALARDPWLAFIEAVAGYVENRPALPRWFAQRSAVLPLDDMEVDAAIAASVLSGNPVEARLLDYERDGMMQTGEEAVVTLSLAAREREDVWPMLEDMARASGWLVWASALAAGQAEGT